MAGSAAGALYLPVRGARRASEDASRVGSQQGSPPDRFAVDLPLRGGKARRYFSVIANEPSQSGGGGAFRSAAIRVANSE
jgi:hypothetical protein